MTFGSVTKACSLAAILFISELGLAQGFYPARSADVVYDVGSAGTTVNGVPNFQKVTDTVFRGGRATESGVQYLKKFGIKTIINLENDPKAIAIELAIAKKLGMQMYSSPLSWQTTPDDKQINTILAALQNPQMYPIYFHCHYGKDRTGLIGGLYRVFAQKWTPKNAYAEMLKYGFHPQFKGLDNYFRAKTGMR